ALDHVREANRPFIGLLGAHQPAEDQFETLNLEAFCHEPMLGTNVVADGDIWERAAVERRWRIAGRRREAIGKLARQDDEVFFRVERAIMPDEYLHRLRRSRPHVGE